MKGPIKYSNYGPSACDARMGQGLKQCLPGLRETMKSAGGLQTHLESLLLVSQYSKRVFLANPKLFFLSKISLPIKKVNSQSF